MKLSSRSFCMLSETLKSSKKLPKALSNFLLSNFSLNFHQQNSQQFSNSSASKSKFIKFPFIQKLLKLPHRLLLATNAINFSDITQKLFKFKVEKLLPSPLESPFTSFPFPPLHLQISHSHVFVINGSNTRAFLLRTSHFDV
jgi:hypothetical protein